MVVIDQLIDFGDSPIFSEATTYTNILLFGKGRPRNTSKAWDLSSAYRNATSLARMLDEHQSGEALFNEDSFVIASAEMAEIKKRIEQVGTPLKDWDIAIYRGILTGFNEAFVIDKKMKSELIAADQNNAEIIKPILRGRDIKRYKVDFVDLWLINTHNGYGNIPPINVNKYPAIKGHLEQYQDKLEKRQDKGKTTYNLRNCAYLDEFAKKKIVYAEIVFDSAFYHDESGFYPEATAFVLTGESTKYLTALLNSQLLTFTFRAFYAGGDLRGDTFRYKKVFLQNLPVIKPTAPASRLTEVLVDYVQTAKPKDQKLQSAYFEQVIDGLVYELYFPDELKAAGKQILLHLGELTPISSAMSEEEQLAIIQREFDRLYDPRHPVRNALETLDSVEVVRTIREALKR
jgi:adenine-specific DNA-methyltransferase